MSIIITTSKHKQCVLDW